MFTINEPFSVEGQVLESNLVTPVSEQLTDREYYSITIMTPELGVLTEIEDCLKTHTPIHQDMEIIGVDLQNYTITACTLNAPRLPKGQQGEFSMGAEVSLRIKLDVKEGEVSATGRVLLVMATAVEEEIFDWTQLPDTFDF